ncbi:MAG: hypothetical protein A2046_01415 [Bacteroidetes bacterium GWA2_30_7]|nr:MAG: hypothetical protein A2046_01415 [Bacteroidetes bacterium GWA2_30_7]
MIAISGIYKNGKVVLERRLPINKTMRVIVTFIDDEFTEYELILEKMLLNKTDPKSKGLDLNKFSFQKSIEATKEYNCSFSDALIEERRND